MTQVVTLQWDLLSGAIMPREPEKNDQGCTRPGLRGLGRVFHSGNWGTR